MGQHLLVAPRPLVQPRRQVIHPSGELGAVEQHEGAQHLGERRAALRGRRDDDVARPRFEQQPPRAVGDEALVALRFGPHRGKLPQRAWQVSPRWDRADAVPIGRGSRRRTASTTMPMTRMTIIIAIRPAASARLRYCWRGDPTRCGERDDEFAASSFARATASLVRSADERGHRGGEKHDVGTRKTMYHHVSRSEQDGWDVVDAGDESVGDRWRRAEYHDEGDRTSSLSPNSEDRRAKNTRSTAWSTAR